MYVTGVESRGCSLQGLWRIFEPNKIDEAVGRADGRRRSHRALTNDEEQRIHREYKSAIADGVALTNADLSNIAVRGYDAEHPHRTRSHTFTASDRFICRYKRDHGISTGIVKRRHRPRTYPTEEIQWTEATEFFDIVTASCKHIGPR